MNIPISSTNGSLAIQHLLSVLENDAFCGIVDALTCEVVYGCRCVGLWLYGLDARGFVNGSAAAERRVG